MTPFYRDKTVCLLLANARDALAGLPADSMAACVTDPPYELDFMGHGWDRSGIAFDPEFWRLVFRVLKPGAYLVACGGTRTYHRMACAIEDAGFEIRDSLAWLYGSGFPKSLNIGDGLGTALKPAFEPVVVARKPFRGTVRANVATHGTGALNIDACRIGGQVDTRRSKGDGPGAFPHNDDGWRPHTSIGGQCDAGRWPANVILDEAAAMVLDEQSGELVSGANPTRLGSDKFRGIYSAFEGQAECDAARGLDIGGASRFFYCAKPSREERDFGCEALAPKSAGEATLRTDGSDGLKSPRAGAGRTGGARNFHPTVKPLGLMRWLVRLVTPVGGTVLDPFLGSGTTGIAARLEERRFVGIEQSADYMPIAAHRICGAFGPLFIIDDEAAADTTSDSQVALF